jgi:alcohol dehydrogenase (NADP+)
MATIEKGTGTIALCSFDSSAELRKHEFGRPDPGPNDVAIDIKYCGMCHSDLHASNGDWGVNMYPIAPGHEVAGLVSAVGSNVSETEFKVGDRVAVGCFVDSCRSCTTCADGLEQHCTQSVQTYSTPFPEGKGENFEQCVGYHTNGGYSSNIVVNKHFTFHVPENVKLEEAGPLLCAGITTFSPLNRHVLQKGGGKGKTVGVVGFGGLGHMAVKLAKAMGAEVVVFSRNNKKEEDAKALGASLLIHTDEEALKGAFRTFDVILDTVSASHEVPPLVGTLKVGGTYVLLGGVPQPFSVSAFALLFHRHCIEGSLVGGVPETQEMLDFCAEHNITPDIKIIHAKDASEQFKAMNAGESGATRAVIDMSTLHEL